MCLISWFQVYLCGVHEWPTGMLKRPDGVNVNSAAVAEEDMNGSLFIALKDEVTKNDKVLIRLCSSWPAYGPLRHRHLSLLCDVGESCLLAPRVSCCA